MKKIIFFNFREINLSKMFVIKNKRKISKITLMLLLILGFFVGNFLVIKSYKNKYANAQTDVSPDAIAIRVIPNPNNYSALRWYNEQKFSGSPQSILVDGYEAVRDGRTVYVNAANTVDTNGDGAPDELYTNIYLISFNQDAEDATADIFGRILSDWKFNTNLPQPGAGKCSIASEDCAGTIGCWHFDGDFKDSSGGGNDGSKIGTINFENGMFGQAMSINGVYGNYIELGSAASSPSLNITNKITISVWIKPNIVKPEGVIVRAGSGGDMIYGFFDDRWQDWYNGTQGPQLDYNLPANEWTHIVVVRDLPNAYVYINNRLVNSSTSWTPIPSLVPTSIRIGGSGSVVQTFNGLIDELKIYDRPLSKEEIANSYSQDIKTCLTDSDCGGKGFCDSLKARITRDVLRLSHFTSIDASIVKYSAEHNNKYPALTAGTYITNYSVSTWPSWSNNLSKELGITLPKDPINKLGSCAGYDPVTCWNETKKKFADPTNDGIFNLPDFSYGYIYQSSDTGDSYKFCANMETWSKFTNIAEYNCARKDVGNTAPVITRINFPRALDGAEYKGYIEAFDADGDLLSWGITCSGNWSGWSPSCPKIQPAQAANQKMIYADKTGGEGAYNFSLTINDGREGGVVSGNYKINIAKTSACFDGDTDGYDSCNLGQTDDDGLPIDCADDNGTRNPGNIEKCSDGIDNNCDNKTDCADSNCASGPDCPAVCNDQICEVDRNECVSCVADCSIGDCCGDGKLSASVGEICDDGNKIANDACNNLCQSTICGDSIIQNNPRNGNYVTEQCDDGNTKSKDGCSENCQNESFFCTPNGCNGLCPPGCSALDDPDCGCYNGNECCGRKCKNSEDNDCSDSCWDGNCNLTDESCITCSHDCDICGINCGNGICDVNIGESIKNNPNYCAVDCNICVFPFVLPCFLQ